jgi:endo-1,4-beta-mannosidase
MMNTRWTPERAWGWYYQQPWLVGCNFIPSTAINQLEMWQAETFDPETITRELGWARGLGFNTARVYLHDLAWLVDAEGFKQRVAYFLDLAAKNKIRPMLQSLTTAGEMNLAPASNLSQRRHT